VARRRVNGTGEGPSRPRWTDWIDPRQVGWLRMLLVFVPATVVAWAAGAPGVVRFALSGLAIVPLAGLIGEATEELACRLGPTLGSLLNATFGNAAELIIALFALGRGLDGVVKASLTGSIIGNLLLVLGASLLAGGVRRRVQRFSRTAAGAGSTLMFLAAIGLLIPAIFHALVGEKNVEAEHGLSFWVAAILVIAYVLSLVFSLVTHPDSVVVEEGEESAIHDEAPWGVGKATTVLIGSTAMVAWMSELLVGAVEEASRALGLTEVFVGVIVVAIVGNAAEHSTAVLMAWKSEMDLAVGIALGSAQQIALFVAPVLVFASYARPRGGPMDLLFTPMEVAAVILAVLIARMVCEDGESNWLEGAMLLMIYAVLGLAFYFLPEPSGHAAATSPF
jgi:Ca2+:H+ antiporter